MDMRKDASRGIETVPIGVTEHVRYEDVNNFVYVSKAVPGPGADMSQFENILGGCKCQAPSNKDDKVCLRSTCECVQPYGCSYNDIGILVGIDPYEPSMKPIYECNHICKCSQNCINRVVQRGITVRLEVSQTSCKGLGLKCLEPIREGQFVCEYAGQVLSKQVAKHRAASQGPTECNYILALREHLADGNILTTYVDPQNTGNAGRFINHSCDPNLFMIPVRIENNVPRLALFALRDINSGEELCYDYSGEIQSINKKLSIDTTEVEDDYAKGIDIAGALNWSTGKVKYKACLCKTTFCRGFLPMDESLYK